MRIKDFWDGLKSDSTIHPADKPFLDVAKGRHTFELNHRPPGPFDGPLYSAKVVICYANPGYDPNDRHYYQEIKKQLSGIEPLPLIPGWVSWYKPRLRGIDLPFDDLRRVVSIFNICPYSSRELTDADLRIAAGLPSVWEAQRHLRDVLLPQALKGEIFLVVARKHQLWGITEGFKSRTIAISRNRGGYLGDDIGAAIDSWLKGK